MQLVRRRLELIAIAGAIVVAASCGGGGGCGGCTQPIPGGFPAAQRTANAGQVRVTNTGLGKITADPASVIGPLVGNAMNGVITFPVVSCGGTNVCCDGNGNAIPNCGPVNIDLTAHPGDAARL